MKDIDGKFFKIICDLKFIRDNQKIIKCIDGKDICNDFDEIIDDLELLREKFSKYQIAIKNIIEELKQKGITISQEKLTDNTIFKNFEEFQKAVFPKSYNKKLEQLKKKNKLIDFKQMLRANKEIEAFFEKKFNNSKYTFNGKLYDLKLYSKDLSEKEIIKLYLDYNE